MKKKVIAVGVLMVLALGGCKNKISYYDKAKTAMEQGNYEEAADNYSKAIMEDEQLQMSYRGVGICSFLTGDYVKAEDYFLRGLGESKGIVGDVELDISYYLAETYVATAKTKEAIDIYTNILEYDDKQSEALVYRGTLYVRAGEVEKAKKDFEKAANNEKDDVSVYYHAYNALKDVDKTADEYLEKGLKCKDDSKESTYMKGCLYKASGDYDTAIKILSDSKEAGFGKSAFTLGEIYELKGDFTTAVSNYNDYIKVSNPSVAEYVTIINCQINAGDYEAAMKNCQSAITNAGESEKKALRFEEIVVLEKIGDFNAAKEKMTKYLEDYPDDEKAKREFEFLQTR